MPQCQCARYRASLSTGRLHSSLSAVVKEVGVGAEVLGVEVDEVAQAEELQGGFADLDLLHDAVLPAGLFHAGEVGVGAEAELDVLPLATLLDVMGWRDLLQDVLGQQDTALS